MASRHLELSAEELEEERQDAAVRLLQNAYRAKRARQLLRELIRQNYVKLLDRSTMTYYYKNKTTGEINANKPIALGNQDLASPRVFIAPLTYDPGSVDGDGYVLIITCTNFSHEKLRNLPSEVNADHGLFEHILTHDFLCKFRSENVISLRNPTCQIFRDTLDRMRRMCKKRGFLFVYLCTHVVEIKSKAYKNENCFLALKDTAWNNSEKAATTAIPLAEFAYALNQISCERKVVTFNFAHYDAIPRSSFKSRYVYPPPDCLTRLADMSKCTVLASCNFGSAIADMKSHTPVRPVTAEGRRGALRVDKTHAEKHVQHMEIGSMVKLAPPTEQAKEIKKMSSFRRMLSMGKDENNASVGPAKSKSAAAPAMTYNLGETSRDMDRDMVFKYQDLWSKADAEQHAKIDRPERPTISWKRKDEEKKKKKGDTASVATGTSGEKSSLTKTKESVDKDTESRASLDSTEKKRTKRLGAKRLQGELDPSMVNVVLPTSREFRQYYIQVTKWWLRQKLSPISDAVSRVSHSYRQNFGFVPQQRSFVRERYTVFGKALCDALTWGAVTPDKEYVSAEAVFLFIRSEMKKVLDGLGEGQRQDPVLFVPREAPFNSTLSHNPMCCRGGPPAAPETPFVVKTGVDNVLLEWSFPQFDGIAPTHYKILMRNNSRLYSKWTVVPGADAIPYVRTIQRYNINHLPMGVPVEFCVAAANNAGWSVPSVASVRVTPGEDLIPQSLPAQWRKLAQGGALAVIDRLEKCPHNRMDHISGFRILMAFGQQQNGFNRANVQSKVAATVMAALKTFPFDPEICIPGFQLIAYCIKGKTQRKTRHFVVQAGIGDIALSYMKRFRNDTSVLNAISWLRQSMPNYIAETPERMDYFTQELTLRDVLDDDEEEQP